MSLVSIDTTILAKHVETAKSMPELYRKNQAYFQSLGLENFVLGINIYQEYAQGGRFHRKYLERCLEGLYESLFELGLVSSINARIKSYIRYLQKMIKHYRDGESVTDIADIYAAKLIAVSCTTEKEAIAKCYESLHLAKLFFKERGFELLSEVDYIKSPKSSGYQDLKMTFLTDKLTASKRPVSFEIQFQSELMNFEASQGRCSHLKYCQLQDACIPIIFDPSKVSISGYLYKDGKIQDRSNLKDPWFFMGKNDSL